MNRNARPAGDVERFRQLLQDIETFASEVNAIVTSIAPDDLGHLDNFVRIFRPFCMPRSGKAERAFFHRLSDQTIHLVLFRSIRRPLVESHDHTLHLLPPYPRANAARYAAP